MTSDATRLKQALTRWAAEVVVDANKRMVDYARQDAPRKSGELARSIHAKPVGGSSSRIEGGLVATVIQAATTDKGARPHVIVAKRPGGKLRFYSAKAGRVVYATKVNHPGNKPQRWWAAMHRRRWPRALALAARGRRL